ncbi:MAG TPA: hypothetical protein VJ499_10670 [Flavisolibacter sp.]|nr:hypothetical protein [Flavisolibacter sp.]
MKRIIITLTLVFALASTYSFATDVKVSSTIMQSFKARFADAENVSWSVTNGFYVAEFTSEDKKQYAYFNTEGDLTVIAEPLTINQLSKKQQANLRKHYSNYNVVDVYKLTDNEDVKYFVVVEDSSKKIILKTTTSTWDVLQSSNK